MDRNTIVLTANNTKIHLGTILDYYGPLISSKLFPKVYQFQHQITGKRSNRPINHFTKKNTVKKIYKKRNFHKQLYADFSKIDVAWGMQWLFENRLSFFQKKYKRYFKYKTKNAIIIQKYARRILVKNAIKKAQSYISQGIEFEIDCITQEPIKIPVIIKPDYENGNITIYNLSTIFNCQKLTITPVYEVIDPVTEDITTYSYELPVLNDNLEELYTSPMTRREVTFRQLSFLYNCLWYQIGLLLVNHRRRTMNSS